MNRVGRDFCDRTGFPRESQDYIVGGVIDESAIRQRFEALAPVLDERGRRRFAAAEARSAGHGGVSAVTRATGIARSTIGRGLAELRGGEAPDAERIRRPGGGRKPVSETDTSLLDDLRSLVEPETRGDPRSPLLWTCKSLRKLSQSLRDMGHRIGRTLVGELLHKLDYRLQANRKTREGSHNPDRNAQFHYINDRVKEALAAGEPAISVDAKKKELVGDFKNAGREWRPKGSPEDVRVDRIVPFAMEVVGSEVEGIHFDVGHLDAGRIGVLIEFAPNLQTGVRRRRGDQLDDDLMADERLAAPVAGDEREQAMLDLVPLAGTGRQVTHGDGNAEFVDQFLQFDLPQSHARTVAAAAISGDQQAAGIGIALAPHQLPPASDGVDRESRGVVVELCRKRFGYEVTLQAGSCFRGGGV